MKIDVSGPDELVAALPYLLGFHPEESMVLVPFSSGLPVARIDLPRDETERSVAVSQLAAPFLRHAHDAGVDPRLAVVCVSEDAQAAARAATAITETLAPQIGVPLKLWANERTWSDLDTGESGPRTRDVVTRFAAEAVASGRQLPARTREDLERPFVGDRSPVAAALPAALENSTRSSIEVERRWVENRINRFLNDGIALSDPDAARVLVGAQVLQVRDAAWSMMTQDEHHSHRALWSDLTRRAPDEVRTPAATMLAFSAWLGGDGASAWTALDQIPEGHEDYGLARIVSRVLEGAVPPSAWTSSIRPGVLDEIAHRREGPEQEPDRGTERGPDRGRGRGHDLEPDIEVATDPRRRRARDAPATDTPRTGRPPTR